MWFNEGMTNKVKECLATYKTTLIVLAWMAQIGKAFISRALLKALGQENYKHTKI